MSQLILHYGSLETAQKKAESAGKELSAYAGKAQAKIAARIVSYSGRHTGNISSAQSYINQKVAQLQNKSAAYLQYAANVGTFLEKARGADHNVKERIETLSGSFKTSYGIKDNIITTIFNYVGDKLNETALGRFFKDMAKIVGKTIVSLKDSIVEWYKYEGGKYIVDAVLAVGAAVLAVCSIIAAIVTGGALIVVIAGVFVGVTACLNAITNCITSVEAYKKEKQGDPAWAKRYGDLDTMTDALRTKNNNVFWHRFANAWDRLEIAANVVLVVNGGIEAFKDFKSIAGNYGGFKEYFRYQYRAGQQGFSVVKNALCGNAGEKARAKELLKLYAKGKITDIKNTASLYLNPRNWLTQGSQRQNIQGYSVSMENLGAGKVSTLYNGSKAGNIKFFGTEITHLGDVTNLGGIRGILRGSDRSFLNIATSINNGEKLYKSVTRINGASFWKSFGICELVPSGRGDEAEWKSVKVSISDFTGIAEKTGKQLTKITSFKSIDYKSLQKMVNMRQNLQAMPAV